MLHSVQFEPAPKDESTIIGPPKPITIADRLMRLKVISDPGEVMILIAGLVSLLIGVSLYLLASSVPAERDRTLPPAAYGTVSAP